MSRLSSRAVIQVLTKEQCVFLEVCMVINMKLVVYMYLVVRVSSKNLLDLGPAQPHTTAEMILSFFAK